MNEEELEEVEEEIPRRRDGDALAVAVVAMAVAVVALVLAVVEVAVVASLVAVVAVALTFGMMTGVVNVVVGSRRWTGGGGGGD